jgi:hypothetical protein
MTTHINILIRVTFRPEFFKECIESILHQDYKNINIICCYDDKLCLKYLNNYKEIDHYYIEKKSDIKYFYNNYCNDLLKKVESGWIMFLDDDDKFYSNNALSLINEKIKTDEDIIFWKFKLKKRHSIYSKNIYDIKPGYIANSSYCFNSKYKSLSKWTAEQTGDFFFIDNLLKKKNFNRIFINENLTGTIWYHKTKFGNEGARNIQMTFKIFFYKYYLENLSYTFDENYYSEKYEDIRKENVKNKKFNFLNHWIKYGKKEYRHCSKEYCKKFNEIFKIAKDEYEKLYR